MKFQKKIGKIIFAHLCGFPQDRCIFEYLLFTHSRQAILLEL